MENDTQTSEKNRSISAAPELLSKLNELDDIIREIEIQQRKGINVSDKLTDVTLQYIELKKQMIIYLDSLEERQLRLQLQYPSKRATPHHIDYPSIIRSILNTN